jgi:tRNA dimethylallyltransferase
MTHKAILIAGPTASGKSAVALEMAQRVDGVIINADAIQVYDCWKIISARPSDEDCAIIPHFLYGHVSGDQDYSVGHWLQDVKKVLSSTSKSPIIVGGTGLYFKALTEGLSEIPSIPDEIRKEGESLLQNYGLEFIVNQLDHETRTSIDCKNSMRVLRAWEVQKATGYNLKYWHKQSTPPLLPISMTEAYTLIPPRSKLYANCDRRVLEMIKNGAVEEVKNAIDAKLHLKSPAMKAIGVSELTKYMNKEYTLDQSVEKMQQATRNYAKRQITWFRNKAKNWRELL